MGEEIDRAEGFRESGAALRSGFPIGSRRVPLLAAAIGLATFFNYRKIFDGSMSVLDSGSGLDQAIYDPSVGSPWLGVLVFLALVYSKREEVFRSMAPRCSYRGALFFLASSGGLTFWAYQIAAYDLLVPSLVLQMVGIALAVGGWRLLRAIAFPLLALVAVIPLPAILINQLVFPMQLWTVSLASFLLDLLGRTHDVAGDLIVTNGIVFQVIEGCSGLKSTMSLILATVALAELVGRDAIEKTVLVMISPAVGIVVNGIRVLILILREVPAESVEHSIHGLLMIVFGVLLMGGIEAVLGRTIFHRRRRAASRVSSRSPMVGQGSVLALGGVAASSVLLGVLVSAAPIGDWGIRRLPNANIETLPPVIQGWKSHRIPFDNGFLGSVWFRHRIYRSYEKGGKSVRVFVGLEDVARRDRSGYSPKTRIPRSGWRSIETPGSPATDATDAEELLIRYPDRPVRVVHARPGYAPWGWELVSKWLGLDPRLGGGDPLKYVIRLETDVESGDGSEADLKLAQLFPEVLEWYRSPR